MKAPSFAATMAAAALAVGVSFVAVGASRLDTPTSKDLLRQSGLPGEEHIVEEARRDRICVEKAGANTLRVTGPGGPQAARARNPEIYDAIGEAISMVQFNWFEIRC